MHQCPIAAVAPVIGADGDDIASSISFTATLGVLMVLELPLLIPFLDLTATQYGVLAGLTVYAVPQVLAATIPAGLAATQIGTLVKLMRVLMLGLVVVGFLLLGAMRSLGLVPDLAVGSIARAAGLLTVVSMAALGLGVDVRVIGRVGGRVTAEVTLSLLLLATSIGLIRAVGLG